MNLRLLFDEMYGRPIIEAFSQLVEFDRSGTQVEQLINILGTNGVPDDEWLPQIKDQGYVVVSRDKGSRSGRAKLPIICMKLGITHVLVVGRIATLPQFEQIRALLSVWPALLNTVEYPAGTRFKLKMSGDRAHLECAVSLKPPEST